MNSRIAENCLDHLLLLSRMSVNGLPTRPSMVAMAMWKVLQGFLFAQQRLQQRSPDVEQFEQGEAPLRIAAEHRLGRAARVRNDRGSQQLDLGQGAGEGVVGPAHDADQDQLVDRPLGVGLRERLLGGDDVARVLVEDRDGNRNAEPDGIVVGVLKVAPAGGDARIGNRLQARDEEFGIALCGDRRPAQQLRIGFDGLHNGLE